MPNFYRGVFAGCIVSGIVLAFVHVIAAVSVFILGAGALLATGDVIPRDFVEVIRRMMGRK